MACYSVIKRRLPGLDDNKCQQQAALDSSHVLSPLYLALNAAFDSCHVTAVFDWRTVWLKGIESLVLTLFNV